ncbi:MAG: (deoxy)nucleoside triphosphate pyrophosphohydrolase [Corallococcus sp.]|nr:(deoxy)nucleoside triphosphate pyrophosphohydrolase [Corallococcus sp.]
MKKHLHVVGAVIIENGKLFAARRGESKYGYVAHKLEFVGGKVEQGETEECALVRELQEEMQMEVAVTSHFYTAEHSYPDFDITLSAYLCDRLSDYIAREHEETAWIPLGELDTDDWAPADKPIIEALKNRNAV